MFPNKYNNVLGVFVKHQVDELAKHYDVKVIATSIHHKLMYEKLQVGHYEVEYMFFPIINSVFLSSMISYRFFILPKIRQVIKEWQPQIIHVHDCRHVPELDSLSELWKNIDTKRFLTVHNIKTHPDKIKFKALRSIYRYCMKKAFTNWTHIFTVNDNLKQIISNIDANQKVTNIGNAIGPLPALPNSLSNTFSYNNYPNKYRFIAVGNLVKEKGFDLLIEAASALIKKYEFQVIIIGDGVERNHLEKLVIQYDLTNVVFLLGRLDNDIVRNLYKDFDAFVLPSYSETFGIVYLEAMYAGLPVIGVRGQGIDGVIKHKENGLLVNPKDVNDLSSNMELIMTNKILSKEMAERGKGLVMQKFMLTDLINRLEQLYES
jgi:glycosyltransferase involved in cell wall biosynthesis